MKKPSGKIDWTIAEGDEAWRASQIAARSEPAHKAPYNKGVALAALIAILLLLLTGGWLLPTQPSPPRTTNQRQSITPIPAFTGAAKTLQIANFTLLYQAVDADAVYETAPKIEQLYATLRHDFGLPTADASSSYTIEVVTQRVQPVTNYFYYQRKISISSPILLSAPVEMPAATLLYQATVYPLARLTLDDRIGQHDKPWESHFMYWISMIDALALWELWQDDAPLASSRGPVVRWLYENSKSERARQRLPDGYERLCLTFQIWQVAPYELLIPLTCTDADLDTEMNVRLSRNKFVPLSTLQQLHRPDDPRDPGKPFTTAITGETMIEYIVAAYGRDKLPQLIAAFGQYTTFDTLIPALFGLSQAEFEAGWQSYLAQHYEK